MPREMHDEQFDENRKISRWSSGPVSSPVRMPWFCTVMQNTNDSTKWSQHELFGASATSYEDLQHCTIEREDAPIASPSRLRQRVPFGAPAKSNEYFKHSVIERKDAPRVTPLPAKAAIWTGYVHNACEFFATSMIFRDNLTLTWTEFHMIQGEIQPTGNQNISL